MALIIWPIIKSADDTLSLSREIGGLIHRFGYNDEILLLINEFGVEIDCNNPIEFSAGGFFRLDLEHLGSVICIFSKELFKNFNKLKFNFRCLPNVLLSWLYFYHLIILKKKTCIS